MFEEQEEASAGRDSVGGRCGGREVSSEACSTLGTYLISASGQAPATVWRVDHRRQEGDH